MQTFSPSANLTLSMRLIFLNVEMRRIPLTLADLDGLKIGVVEGYAYGESFYKPSDFNRVSKGTVQENLRSSWPGSSTWCWPMHASRFIS